MLRLNIASNTNRSLLKVAMVPASADLKKLVGLARDKLRIKGARGFYTGGGRELLDGEELQADMLLLAHRGESFVGKLSDISDPVQGSELEPLAPAIDSAFERMWQRVGFVDAAMPQLRILTFNIVAPCLAQGTAVAGDESADIEEGAEPAAIEHEPDAAVVRGCGVYYAAKPPRCKQPLSHNFQCDQSALAWKYRFPRLQSELLQHRPDVLCLQEMDATAWSDCGRLMQERGYSCGVCSKAKGGANNFVAMFWREDRLQAVQEPEIVYLTAEGTITAIIQRLRLLPMAGGEQGPTTFIVVTTHLKAGLKEKNEEDRAKQVDDLVAVLERFMEPNEDVVFTGDLNAHLEALPFFAAPPGGETLSALPGLVLPRLTRRGFRCAVSEATGGSPLTFSQWGRRCDVEIRSVIDHVLLRGPHLVACAALAAPDEAVVAAMGCLPNPAYPSDHIPVIVDVAFKPASGGTDVATRTMSERELLCLGQDLPHEGRVALTEDGFKYVALPKKWQASQGCLVEAASACYTSSAPEALAADRAALERQLARHQGAAECSWGFWSPTSCVGLHISLGKHANALHVGKRVRFQVKKLLHFQTRKLGEPSTSGGSNIFCARWFTFEVKLIDEVHCEGEEPHISFAVFGARRAMELTQEAQPQAKVAGQPAAPA